MDFKFTSSDLYGLLLFYMIAIPVTMYGYDYPSELYEALYDAMVYIIFSAIGLYLIVFVIFKYFFPRRQMVLLFLITLITLVGLGLAELYCYYLNDSINIQENVTIVRFCMVGLDMALENMGILIGLFAGKKFYDIQLDLERRTKEKKENELRLLKAQIDPHFLFNNLNTLDALIDNKPTVAKEYLHSLSQLYRYLIATKDDEVVLLKDELAFVKHYIALLEIRFGDIYTFEIVGQLEVIDQLLVPPGSIQTLIENVVKHNAGTKEIPISTSIHLNEKEVVITNNIVEILDNRNSNQTGLANLKARYKLLTDRQIIVTNTDRFMVKIPLLNQV